MNIKKYFYQEIWNIGIIRHDKPTKVDELTNICQDKKVYWLQEKYHFQADPFLVEHNNHLYVFYEALNHTWVKGHLRCRVLDLQMNELDDFAIDDINMLGCHLSFPQIYYIDNEFYLMPESHENQAIYLFKATDFPKKWQKITQISDQPCIDSVLYFDKNQGRYIIISNNQKTLTRHLFVSQDLTEHWQKINLTDDFIQADNTHQRLGGGVIEIDKTLFLPMQEFDRKEYGKSLFIKHIILPSMENGQAITAWQETTECQIKSQSECYPDGLHTLNISEHYVIVDAKRWGFQPLNFFVRKYRQIRQKFYFLSKNK
ncbi:glucosamine inositolphosphorylceramide transferase family protein [Faucicola boevrei]|uniref:glucosamine inositolphosphorylceramide transferase family protein n=1 Tax=Faucicola boevrei TaxID=346665 RepID=UPI000377B7F3|nr:hypothetical protein [Moraxella boevrei]